MANTPRGHIRRHGNRYQVAVCLGRDPITKRYRYTYASAKTYEKAKEERDKLIKRVEEGREPDIKATVNVVLDRWLAVAELAVSTRDTYRSYIDKRIRPVLGDMPVRTLEHRVDMLDQFYAHLRRCGRLCDGRRSMEHRTAVPHECDERCRPHVCQGASPRTIRQIHSILRRALSFAVKWGWMERNPAELATLPKLAPSDISPPEPEKAAVLVDAAWEFAPDLGVFVWLAMVTGARRGELCVLRWSDVRFEDADLLIARSYVVRKGNKVVKETKTQQRRRLALDPATVKVLKEHWERCAKRAEQAGESLQEDGYVFHRDCSGEDAWLPDTVSHQFGRIASNAGIPCRLHDLRHYSATQMIASGVDLRTVAGRLGHSGGGSITLKVYSHWTRPADQHAAEVLAQQLRKPGGTGSRDGRADPT